MKHTATALAVFLAASNILAGNWPQWRGPNQDGSSDEKNLPEKFSKTESVRWAADLPSGSASTPAVWGESVFITAIDEAQQALLGLCIDATTGKERWRKTISTGQIRWDSNSNLASPSPVTDGAHVWFFYATGDLACFDFAGKEVWKRNVCEKHGMFGTQWTYSSSAVLDGGKLYIQVLQRDEAFEFKGVFKGNKDGDHASYILALDPATGKDVWKHIRPSAAQVESLESFSTPVFTTHGGKRLMLISGGDTLSIHDAASGAEQARMATWNLAGETYNKFFRLVPSPVVGDGIALVCAPKNSPVFAMSLDSKGEVKPVWQTEPKGVTSDVSTPVFYAGHFFVLDSGKRILSCLDPKTGAVKWSGELGGKAKIESSPVAADGKIYMTDFWGQVYVVKASTEKLEMLSVADLGNGSKMSGNDGSVRASIAIANSALFIRVQDKLYCVSK